MFDFKTYLAAKQRTINRELDARMPAERARPAILHKAMRYSVLSGGKRIRPILVMAAAEAAGGNPGCALVPALAIEVLHTYTLIHDDLPCMDDDDLRRGRPTAHKVFGEANALLAGDALLTLAFEWLASAAAPAPYPPTAFALELARAAGSAGVIGGQAEDIAATGRKPTASLVRYIHSRKTGLLIRAAVRMGAIAAGASGRELAAVTRYGECLGLAFQIADDILNETSSRERLGKPSGSDKARGKMTWVAVHGLRAASAETARLTKEAIEAVKVLPGNTAPLRAMAGHLAKRKW